jgi:UvrD-like helicase family protein
VDEGVPPSRILLVSFTRTAVAELRARIVSYAVAGEAAKSVRISTLDSYAWSLRSGFKTDSERKTLDGQSFDFSIAKAVGLFRERDPDLLEFMDRLEHLIIDEAQDIVGLRSDLVIEMLRSLNKDCGVTILADPEQAIYGFTSDDDLTRGERGDLLSRLPEESPCKVVTRELTENHRIKNDLLLGVFNSTRKELADRSDPGGYVGRLVSRIKEEGSENLGSTSHERIAHLLDATNADNVLVLFRRRSDVLITSSYCSHLGIDHRIRMSGSPVIVSPWLGWLLGSFEGNFLGHQEFVDLWDAQIRKAPAPFEGIDQEWCWTTLHQLAAASYESTIDLIQLRRLLSRGRAPAELCLPDLGTHGPILGTIHASKGREADTVMLMMPKDFNPAEDSESAIFEEGRVYYVGATRARRVLRVADHSAPQVSYLQSKRIFRWINPKQVQVEIGRDGDVDGVAPLAWASGAKNQELLATLTNRTVKVRLDAQPDDGYRWRVIFEDRTSPHLTRDVNLADMSESFKVDLGRLWGIVDKDQHLRPSTTIKHAYIVGTSTIALSEDERKAVKPPFRNSGLALVPVLKGFSPLYFFSRYRARGRN